MENTSRRVALGDLQNWGPIAAINRALKTSKDLKTAKPRVDTRWNKQPLGTTDVGHVPKTLKGQTSVKSIPKLDKAKENTLSKKPLTRTMSLPKDSPISSPAKEAASPEAVKDIDAEDKGNLILVPEYVNNIYHHLRQVEERLPIGKDHLAGQKEVSPRMRAMLIDWLSEVHLEFRLTVETFQLTVAIIDRFLQAVKDTERTSFQLVGVTALFLATKYEELFPPPIADLVYITDNTYKAWQICRMELVILKAIDYNLSSPLPIHFLRRYSKAANAEEEHHTMAKYFIELAALDYGLASSRPSEIAAASLFLSLHLLSGSHPSGPGLNDLLWTPTLTFYSRYSAAHLSPLARQIAKLAREAPRAKLQGVYRKYQDRKFHRISLREELSGPLIDSVIGQGQQKKFLVNMLQFLN